MAALGDQLDVRGDTRRRILNTARRLFSDSGYLGVSMNDIAKHLGITKAALYHHFTGKASIYGAVLEEAFSGLSAQIANALEQETAEGRLRRLITNYLQFGIRERNLVNAIVTKLPSDASDTRVRVARFREELADQVQSIIEQNLVQVGDSRLVASLLMCMMDGLLLESSLFDKVVDASKVADEIMAILGVRGNPPTPLQAH